LGGNPNQNQFWYSPVSADPRCPENLGDTPILVVQSQVRFT
jgi:hypothetical protein